MANLTPATQTFSDARRSCRAPDVLAETSLIAELPRDGGAAMMDHSYLILRVCDTFLAVPCIAVEEMVLMPTVTAVPNQAPALRGMVNLRGRLLLLLDLRVRLGMASYAQEMADLGQMLLDREQDHRKWISELRASVDEKRSFTLARDPHQCKFGKWYDSFRFRNVSVAITSLWRSLDEPHRRIHGIADAVCHLTSQSRFDEARAIINAARDTDLQELCRTFASLRAILRETSREVVVVVRSGKGQVALSVDEVMAAETIDPASIKRLPESAGELALSLTPRVATRRDSKQLVALVDVDRIVHGLSNTAA